MLIIPIDKDEQSVIDKQFQQSAVANKLLFTASPLSSPKRKLSNSSHSEALADYEAEKSYALNKALNVVEISQEKKERYDSLKVKLNKFGY